ncbi:glycosyltransferase family 2 protein [Nonomuraea sp. NPDC050556]|uniref:glycosyltransferase family 2 protein n=1 Tax=Nonomuraea sp. NPDC050556 TaxID=3364369 RepID=UPI00378FCCED
MSLSVVIPCFNEADNIPHVYAEVVAEFGEHDLELVFVDDGSTDGTLEALKKLAESDPRVQYISFTRNFGFEAAFSAGYLYAGRDWILHLDADQQFPAAEGRRLFEVAQEGYDAVFGVRVDRDDPWVRRAGSAAFHALSRWLRIEVPRGATAFRLVRASLARTIVELELGTPYFLATVPRLTNRYTTVPVTHRGRTRGSSKVNVLWLARHALDLYVSVGRRLTSAAAGLSTAAAVVALLCAIVSPAGRTVPFLLAAVVLAVQGFTVRYLVSIAAGQARPRLFYVREATLPIREADRL